MSESLITTLKIILIVFDVLIILSIICYAFKGFRKGLIHTSLVLASRILPLLLILLFIKPIGKIIIHAHIPYDEEVLTEEVSISGIVKTEIANNYFDGNLDELIQTKLDLLIDDFLISMVGIVLYIVFAIFVFLILSPLIRLIFRLTLPFAKTKEHHLLSRILGGCLGVCSYFVLFVVLILPVYGALETGKVIINEAATYDANLNETKEVVNSITDSSVTLKLTSHLGKTKEGKFGLGAKYFGQNLSIKTEYGKINIIKELDAIGAYLPRAIELFQNFTKEDRDINYMVDELNEEDINSIIAYLAKSKIIKVAYPTLMNILKVKEEHIDLIKRSNLNYDELITIDINQDLEQSQTFFVAVLKIAKEIDLNNVSIEAILTNQNIKLNISNALDEGFNLEISEKGLSKILICYLDDLLKENNFEHLMGLIDIDYLKNDLADDFLTLADIYTTLDENGVIAYFANENPNLSITDELRTKINHAIDQLFGLKLLENQEKKLVQTAFMFTDYDQEKLNQMLNENIDWHQEVDSVAKMAVSVLELIIEAKLNQDDMTAMLENNHIVDILTDVIDETFKMQLSEKYFVPLVIQYLEDYLNNHNLSEFVGIITPDYLQHFFTSDFHLLVNNYKTIKELKIVEYFQNKEENRIEVTPEFELKLQEAINGILSMKLVENHENIFIKKIFSFMPEEININVEEMLKEDIDWQVELHSLGTTLKEAMVFIIDTDLNPDELSVLLDNQKARTRLPILMEQIFQLQISEKYLAPIVIDYLEKMFVNTSFDEMVNYITPSYLKNEFTKDIDTIFDIYDLSKELKLEEHFDSTNQYQLDLNVETNEMKFRDFVNKILSLRLICSHEKELITKILELTKMDQIISFDASSLDAVDWESERANLVDISVELVKLSNIDHVFSDNYLEASNYLEISNQFAATFDALVQSQVTSEYAFQIITEMLKSTGYQVQLSDDDKQTIIENTAVWEFEILTKVSKKGLALFAEDEEGNIDFEKIQGEEITSLMLLASDGVIASKLCGAILNDMLGVNGLNMLPVDESTNLPLYDFTLPTTLKTQAISIGTTFNLAKNIKNLDIDHMTTNDIDELKQNIEAFDRNDMDYNFVEDVFNTIISGNTSMKIDDTTNWQEEASTITSVLEAYQNTSDKENFNIQDDESLSNMVNNSELAKTFLEYLGLIK